MPNLEQVELAEKVLDFIKAHPHAHDQKTFLSFGDVWTDEHRQARTELGKHPDVVVALECGAKACFCGWLAILDNQKFNSLFEVHDPDTGDDLALHEWGSLRLGIDQWDGDHTSDHLFADDNTVADLERHVWNMRAAYEASTTVDERAFDLDEARFGFELDA